MAKPIVSNVYAGGLTVDPRVGAGVVADIGSILLRDGSAELYQKFGAGNTDWQLIAPGGASVLTFGSGGLGTAADTRFLPPGRITGTAPTTDDFQMPLTRAGTLRRLFVYHRTPPGGAVNITYTVMINGVATALTVTLAANANGPASDLVNTVAVAINDRVSLRAVKAAIIAASTVDVQTSVEFF